MSAHEEADETRPAVPPRSSQRDSTSNSTSHRDSLYRASPQISPVQPAHPVVAESSKAPVAPPVPEQSAQQQQHQPAPTGQPTQAQQVHNLFPGTAAPETFKTKRQELEEGDAHWKWKVGFRAISIIVGLIGIGCAAWITSNYNNSNSYTSSSYYYYYYDDYLIPYTLVTFILSVLWSAACVIAFFARRPNRPIHPGAQVGCDLVLWLGFAVTGAFAVIGTLSIYYSGQDDYSSSSGGYTQASNGTWVWTSSSYSSSSSSASTRSCEYYSSSSSSSCAAQDAYFNAFMHSKDQRYNLDLTVTVCQFIALLMHFILFVWACVDTARRNNRGVSKDAEKLAADIVMNMVKNGAIIPAPGQAYFPPMAQQGAPMGSVPMMYPQQQYHPQQFPGQLPGQYNTPISHGKTPIPQPPVASSSDEKGAGARHATGPDHSTNAASLMNPAILNPNPGLSRLSSFSAPRHLRYSETTDGSSSIPNACVTKQRNTSILDIGIPLETPATVCSAPDSEKLPTTVRPPVTALPQGSCATSWTRAEEMSEIICWKERKPTPTRSSDYTRRPRTRMQAASFRCEALDDAVERDSEASDGEEAEFDLGSCHAV
ncbi:hypothetical protein PSPO01_07882 [Paraphaeosphaeria sporulosa]